MKLSVVICCIGIGLSAIASGCGGDGAFSLDPVASAADKTASAGSAKVIVAMTLSKAGKTLSVPGSGVADMQTGDADITFDFSQISKLAGSQATGTQAEEITKGGIAYLKIPFTGLPAGKQWIKVDPKEAAKAAGLPLSNQGSQTPGQLMGILKGAVSEKNLGSETIAGTQTTHYETTVDTAKLLSASHPQPWMKAALAHAPKTQTYDVWIDASSLVRRMQIGIDSGTMTMDFSDFGTPIDVQAPAADEVVDALALLKGTQGQGP